MSILQKIRVLLEAIKFEHTVFALPFALMGMLLASRGWPEGGNRWPSVETAVWIVLAAVFARSSAMGFNRWADSEIDARNPRTRQRAIPAGLLKRGFMLAFSLTAAALLCVAAGMLNRLCLILSLPCLAVLLGYSYSKRFTSISHFWLGMSLGMAPVGAWIAVRGRFDVLPLILGAAVTFWVAGFDVLYSCQDYEVDRAERLHSIPCRFGIPAALRISSYIHIFAWIGFAAVGWIGGMQRWYLIGLLGAAALLIWQHRIVKPNDLSRLNAAFFTANGFISIGLFAAAGLDILL